MNEVLKKIRDFADEAHGDQQRKYLPERYIEHPVRVMKFCTAFTASLPALAAALLHDVLEDTPVTQKELRDFLVTTMNEDDAEKTIGIVIELTDVYTKKNYPRMNRKKRRRQEAKRIGRTSAEAQTIKYADIIDNCRGIASQDSDFAPVFLKECKMLLDEMNKGVADLRRKAMDIIETEMNFLETTGISQSDL